MPKNVGDPFPWQFITVFNHVSLYYIAGGQLGLWLGMSVITGFELLALVSGILHKCLATIFMRNKPKDSSQENNNPV